MNTTTKLRASSLTRILASVSGVLCLVMMASQACTPIDGGLTDGFFDDPACSGSPVDITGLWRIEGTGNRQQCIDDKFNADTISLGSIPLEFAQSGDTFELASSPTTEPGGSFEVTNATIRGVCISFTTIEKGRVGTLIYDWRGKLDADRVVRGEFQGDGPSRCVTQGSFSATIAR